MGILLAITPIIIFAVFLVWMDCFKLVKYKYIAIAILAGSISSLVSYLANNFALSYMGLDQKTVFQLVAPFIEEFFKISIILFFIKRNLTGFLIDSVIYGFSIGTGFALIENIFYYFILTDSGIQIHLVRGFGTAIMHGCTVALAAGLIHYLFNSKKLNFGISVSISFFMAYLIHSFYNSFLLDPTIQTVIIIAIFTFSILLLFNINEKNIRKWINDEFDSELELLSMLDSGKIRETKTGQYILEIKNRFSPFIVLDMICFIRLNLELSMQYKTYLMLRSNEMEIPEDIELQSKISEYENLKKLIGKTGLSALKPVLSLDNKDHWKINQLK